VNLVWPPHRPLLRRSSCPYTFWLKPSVRRQHRAGRSSCLCSFPRRLFTEHTIFHTAEGNFVYGTGIFSHTTVKSKPYDYPAATTSEAPSPYTFVVWLIRESTVTHGHRLSNAQTKRSRASTPHFNGASPASTRWSSGRCPPAPSPTAATSPATCVTTEKRSNGEYTPLTTAKATATVDTDNRIIDITALTA
jgi:hypothetical protein